MAVQESATLPAIDILVEARGWPPEAELRRLAERTLSAAIAGADLRLSPSSELSLVFTDDDHIRALSRQYRGKDTATNVLSFPAAPMKAGAFGPLLGDLVFAHETIAREAAADALSLEDHLAHLVVHGFLHLAGHDHEDDREAAVMEKLETAILARLGVADPYGGGDG